MSAVLVDSKVLLDVMTADPRWFPWSSKALANAADHWRLVINPVICAEVSIRYTRIEDLDVALSKELLQREPIPYEAAFLAGKAFKNYRQQGGAKRSTLPDFFIGAHGAIAGYRLLTRDGAWYRSYFPTAHVVAP